MDTYKLFLLCKGHLDSCISSNVLALIFPLVNPHGLVLTSSLHFQGSFLLPSSIYVSQLEFSLHLLLLFHIPVLLLQFLTTYVHLIDAHNSFTIVPSYSARYV